MLPKAASWLQWVMILMQPLNAARLFTASLSQYPNLDQEGKTTLNHVNSSLKIAGELLNRSMLDISKLDSNMVEVNRRDFAIADLIDGLAVEFDAMSKDCLIKFNYAFQAQYHH